MPATRRPQSKRPPKPKPSPEPAASQLPDENPPGQNPSPTPSPPDAPAAASSTGSSDAEFIADPGPGFNAKTAPAAPLVEEPDIPFEEWDEARIREFLTLQGEVTHAMLAIKAAGDEETWKHTKQDLNSIAPPLTRILNRYDATRAMAAAGDELLLGAAVTRYGARNYSKRRRYLAALAAQEPQPITGVPAEPGTGPESDPEWERLHEVPPAIIPKGRR